LPPDPASGRHIRCGITTVLDSLRVWSEDGVEEVDGEAAVLAQAIAQARAAGMLRVSHFLHLRCEVPMPNVVAEAAELIGRSEVRLLSLMDHTPGQRQFRDERKLREYYRGKKGSLTDAELDRLFAKRIEYQAAHAAENYRRLVELARSHGIPLASHDDTTREHVEQAIQDRVAIAEFPTTVEAAQQAVGLDDRGEIASGKRADLIRVRSFEQLPVVQTVWCAGRRVA
jgi:alpha-D-ribose 1-methylphosphonate 5-triphosphate diphosphatase